MIEKQICDVDNQCKHETHHNINVYFLIVFDYDETTSCHDK